MRLNMKAPITHKMIGIVLCVLIQTPIVHAQVTKENIKNLNNALENYEKTNERIAENLREKKKEEEKKRNKELVLKEKFRQQLEKIESDSTQTESTDKNSIQNNR